MTPLITTPSRQQPQLQRLRFLQQVIARRPGRGQMGPLRRCVRRQRHLLHRFIQQTYRHVQLHRSRVLLPWIVPGTVHEAHP